MSNLSEVYARQLIDAALQGALLLAVTAALVLLLGQRVSSALAPPAAAGAMLCLVLPLSALAITRTAPQAAAGQDVDESFTVALDGSARFQSIQAAVDAAPEHGLVRIAAAYENPLATDQELYLKLQAALGQVSDVAEAARIRERFQLEHGPRPTLGVSGARGVVVRGLSLSQPGIAVEGTSQAGSIVAIDAAELQLESCAVLGSPASGISIHGASKVELRDCLVAGVHATGIQVVGAEPEVRILNCELRNCRHRGITVGRNAATTIAGCRISGSDWHGIRYDDAAPTITGNLIFENARSGIYASGETRAQISGNLFFRNAMTGISCLVQNQDRIEGNTFVEDVRSGIEVSGASQPTIRRNLFFGLKQAVRWGSTSGGGLTDNIYWEVENERVGSGAQITEQGARTVDPLFVAAGERNYRLAPDSPARAAGVGAAEPLGFASPWPKQPEEGALVTARSEKAEREADMHASQLAFARAKLLVEDLMQIQDVARRDAAVAAMRAGLQSEDPVERHAALSAFVQTQQSNYERASFRELLLPLCSSETGDAQVQAFYALSSSGRQPGDERLLLEALRAPSALLRTRGTGLLMSYFDKQMTGEAGAAALKLLDGAVGSREVLAGLWGATAAPELQEKLLELAARPDLRHDAIYFGLSTMQNKSRAVVEHLLAALAELDFNVSTRALWGLGQGVAEGEHDLVADTLLLLFEARSDAHTRGGSLDLLARYGGPAQLPALRALAANELISEDLRAQVQRTIAAIEAR